jgi:pyruvate dehydrogenase E2 component (dihydrolipoamide acetyltransferase)
MGEFTMPSLGADMTEGTLTEWLVGPGDHVHKGDIVAVVDTAKADIEVECFETGVIQRLLVEPGTLVPVGTALAVIAAEPATPPPGAAPVAPKPPPAPAAPEEALPTRPAPETVGALASPLIRHLAKETGVAMADVHGSGPGGRVTRADVLAAASSPPRHPKEPTQAPAPVQAPPLSPASERRGHGRRRHGGGTAPYPAERIRATPLARRLAKEAGLDIGQLAGTGAQGAIRAADVRGELQHAHPTEPGPPRPAPPSAESAAAPASRAEAMRRAIGTLMARSKREIPHYYLSTTVDMTAATEWLRKRNLALPVTERLVPAALLLKAAARAAREVPQLNGFWSDERFVPAAAVHLGVAVSLRGGGLVAPAIHDAADLPLPEIMAKLRDLVARARAGRLRGSETADPTITVTSLGDQGVEAVFGVIYPPQVALVGLGKVVERPWAIDGMLGVRPVVTATLSADHRASDGATGARYLLAFERQLQKPEEL